MSWTKHLALQHHIPEELMPPYLSFWTVSVITWLIAELLAFCLPFHDAISHCPLQLFGDYAHTFTCGCKLSENGVHIHVSTSAASPGLHRCSALGHRSHASQSFGVTRSRLCTVWVINPYLTRVGIEILMRGLWKLWVLFEQKEIKLLNKWRFVESETEIMQHVLRMQ